MSKITMTLTGSAALKEAFESVSQGMARRVLRRATADAMKEEVKAAKARAPVDDGLLKKSIGVNVKTYRNTGIVVATVGPRWGFSKPALDRHGAVKTRTVQRKAGPVTYNREIKPAYYAIPVEFGHVTKGGSFVPPVAFMRSSMASTAPVVAMKWQEAMLAGLVKEAAKAAART